MPALLPSKPPSLTRASIVTPGDWTELDLDPSTRHRSIRNAVRRAAARSHNLAPDAIALIALLDRTSRQAADAGGFYCASLVIKGASGDRVAANVLLQMYPSLTASLLSVPPGVPVPSVGERCASLAEVIRDDPERYGSNVRVVPLALVGPSVRVQLENRGVIVQYIAPLADGTADIVMTFSCACPPYTRLMTQLFDAMAQSLELHYDRVVHR